MRTKIEEPQVEDAGRVTMSVNGGEEVDVTESLARFVRVQDRDVAILRTAGEMAKKAGEAAAKACKKADLTEEESAAAALAGYAEEALLFLDRRQHGTVELWEGHKRALRTGCRLFFDECTKIHQKQVELDIGTSETDERAQEIRRVFTRVLKAPAAQLDIADDGEE